MNNVKTINFFPNSPDEKKLKLRKMLYIVDLTRVVISYEIYETSLRRVS